MCVNAGPLDRALRVTLGIALIVYGIVIGNMIIAGVGVIPLLTAFIGFCPFYKLFNMDTGCSEKD